MLFIVSAGRVYVIVCERVGYIGPIRMYTVYFSGRFSHKIAA